MTYAFSEEILPSNRAGFKRVYDQIDSAKDRVQSFLQAYRVELPERPKATGDPLRTTAEQFKLALSRVSMHLQKDFRVGLIAQIDRLLDPEEWEDDDIVPSAASFGTFIQLLLLNPSRRPGIGAAGDGSITAAWTAGANRLTIDCYPKNTVRWVLSRMQDGEIERAAGDTHINRLSIVLAPYSLTETWFQDADNVLRG